MRGMDRRCYYIPLEQLGLEPRPLNPGEWTESNITQNDIVELEMDDMNQHECMATMTALIKHMQKTNITPKVEEVFQPYAKEWLGPLLQLVVSGNNGGDGIHYMVVEIGNLKNEILANRLLEFLMKNCFHEKRVVLIFDRFAGRDPNTKDNSVGIQLLGIVLANNLPPYDWKCEIDSE
eukprot:g41697.t1